MLRCVTTILLTADNWSDMLGENYKLQTIRAPQVDVALWRKIQQTPDSLECLSADEIYGLLQQ